jgi:hypothetical protein
VELAEAEMVEDIYLILKMVKLEQTDLAEVVVHLVGVEDQCLRAQVALVQLF